MKFVKLSLIAIVIISISVSVVDSIPKYDLGGFVPSSLDYYEKTAKSQDQMAVPSDASMKNESVSTTRSLDSNENDNSSQRNQEPRFGFTNVGSTGSGYAISPYGSSKVDLGGLILGAVIGVGTILIIPKLLYIISGSYGSYARSDEGGIAQSMTKLDDILAHHGIDTTSCMQRAVCSYTKKASESMRTANDIEDDEKVSPFDRIIETVTSNHIFRTAMRGTAIQEAIDAGRKSQNCSRIYRHCGFSMDTILGLMSNIISSVGSVNSQSIEPTSPAAS